MASSIISVNGQLGLFPSRQLASGNSSYFVATNPTLGTGVQYALKTSFSATANGLFTVTNNNPLTGSKIYMDSISLLMTGTAPTATTVMVFNLFVEQGVVTPSAGNAVITAVSPNSGTANSATNALINAYTGAAAMTIPAAVGTRRSIGSVYLPTSLGITGDTYVLQFGPSMPAASAGLTAVRATAAATIIGNAPPVVLAPNTSLIVDCYWLTQASTAPTFEYSLNYMEG